MPAWVAFVCGAAVALLTLWLVRRPGAREGASRWYHWTAYAAWCLWTVAGVSFVLLNQAGGHATAAGVGALLFFGVSALAALGLARLFGLLPTGGASRRVSP